MYVVRVSTGWLNLDAYSRFIEDKEYNRLLLCAGDAGSGAMLPLVGADAEIVRTHLDADTHRVAEWRRP